jgi:hypothetical protein
MPIHVIQGERDFYEKATNHLREQTKLTFSIHGVPEEDKTRIKDALQELLSAEVINLEQEKLRARGVGDEFLKASDLRPTLEELPLPEKDRTLLEAKVRRAARQFVSRQAEGGPEAGTERSVEPIVQFSHDWQSHDTHASVRGVLVRAAFPGTYESLYEFRLPPYPPGSNYLIISVYLKGLPPDNAIYLRVEPFSSSPEEMEVGLASQVAWHREIRIWDLCRGQVASVQQPRPSNDPRYIRLQKSITCGPQTLVFSDGFWNFAHFDNVRFWSVFGGKKLTFYWVEGPFTLPAWLSTYRTIRAVHSGKVLGVVNSSTVNGAHIEQYDWLSGTDQQWFFHWLGGDEYKIVNRNSGKVLDVVGRSTANGAEIQQYDWLGGTNQIWRFEQVAGGDEYKIVNRNSGKVLDVHGVSMANGARLVQWDYVGGNNQKWTFLKDKTARYRNIIKMKHQLTTNTLHSHARNYGHPGTSGQQQVTAFAGWDDNDLWRVKGPDGQPATFKEGEPVQHGDTIRLEHVPTGRNLHSHGGVPSPVTGQQEVTCYGNNGIGDANDNWRIEIEGGGTWDSGKRLRLIHVLTNHALHSHSGFSHPQWTAGQQEVTGFAGRDDNDWWSLFEIR